MNLALVIVAFSRLRGRPAVPNSMQLVFAGGYNPCLEGSIRTLGNLIDLARMCKLTFELANPVLMPLLIQSQLQASNPKPGSSLIDTGRQKPLVESRGK